MPPIHSIFQAKVANIFNNVCPAIILAKEDDTCIGWNMYDTLHLFRTTIEVIVHKFITIDIFR
eukprot:765420-Hanusia_phi.AAC.3